MLDIFIIGSKGIPAKYGGFETFVDNLTRLKRNKDIRYHVSNLSTNNEEYIYNDARCFNVNVPMVGSARAVLYDVYSLGESIKFIQKNKLKNSIIYILASRIGPFMWLFKKKIKKLGIKVLLNPDGHEWKRSKWNYLIRKYWKLSERLMVKNADLIVCDSEGIEKYILGEYSSYNPITTFIAYGADMSSSKLKNGDENVMNWFKSFKLKSKEYYLIVGRFVPENNYELIIKEFLNSNTKKDLVIISNVEQNSFYSQLVKNTDFEKDERIKFVGTVYDQELLKKIRECAFGYIHGHEVGGTNPSLLEALASTEVNLLLDVIFNKEVGREGAVYFSKEEGNLSKLIGQLDIYSEDDKHILGLKAKQRIKDFYSWEKIVDEYENTFLELKI
ncbi:beta 1-4 rhamnosyltransferase Cps2T [Niallia circulans]|uniref:beta 1-4 rhamnosyltransferase Cps2T n=1 Tax=Niallia circulans TaxID=1397 RepID=UPI00351643E3